MVSPIEPFQRQQKVFKIAVLRRRIDGQYDACVPETRVLSEAFALVVKGLGGTASPDGVLYETEHPETWGIVFDLVNLKMRNQKLLQLHMVAADLLGVLLLTLAE